MDAPRKIDALVVGSLALARRGMVAKPSRAQGCADVKAVVEDIYKMPLGCRYNNVAVARPTATWEGVTGDSPKTIDGSDKEGSGKTVIVITVEWNQGPEPDVDEKLVEREHLSMYLQALASEMLDDEEDDEEDEPEAAEATS